MNIKDKEIEVTVRGNDKFKSYYLRIPPDIVRLLDIRRRDVFLIQYKDGYLIYNRDVKNTNKLKK